MKRVGMVRLIVFFLFVFTSVNAQTDLTIEGKTYKNSDDTWLGVDIPRSAPTKLIFRNNTITSVNRYGYMLQAGDEAPGSTNNNLDGALITGNKFNWSGSDMTIITHGLFTGHNRNVVAKYNYLDNIPMGIIRKSGNNMTNSGGGVAYNIVKNGAVAMVIKGMSNVNVYNNTFYTDRTTSETWRPLLNIYTNTDGGRYSVAHGTRIFNNIFYTKNQTFAITIDDEESLTGLVCDYNVYWCESGSPRFKVNGSVKTFAQWQAMGYDTHSVVADPKFKDLINFVPSERLDYGTDLGADWSVGLATGASWGSGDPATTAQNGKWQVGAVILPGSSSAEIPPVPPASADTTTTPGSNVTGDKSEIITVPTIAKDFLDVTVANAKPSVSKILRIFDFSGKMYVEKNLDTASTRIPFSLNAGIYILKVQTGDTDRLIQKLIVVK
jgi:hypothetical protein